MTDEAEWAWMEGLSDCQRSDLNQYRAMSMRTDIPNFVRGEGGGVTPYTVACEMGWVEHEQGSCSELQLVYEVILDLVAGGDLVYRDHLLYPPPDRPPEPTFTEVESR